MPKGYFLVDNYLELVEREVRNRFAYLWQEKMLFRFPDGSHIPRGVFGLGKTEFEDRPRQADDPIKPAFPDMPKAFMDSPERLCVLYVPPHQGAVGV